MNTGRVLEIAFLTKRIRQICEDNEDAVAEYGDDIADALKARLSDLRAAEFVHDLVVGYPRAAGGMFIIDLIGRFKLLLEANHVSNPILDSGDVDWRKVRRIKVLGIEQLDD